MIVPLCMALFFAVLAWASAHWRAGFNAERADYWYRRYLETDDERLKLQATAIAQRQRLDDMRSA